MVDSVAEALVGGDARTMTKTRQTEVVRGFFRNHVYAKGAQRRRDQAYLLQQRHCAPSVERLVS